MFAPYLLPAWIAVTFIALAAGAAGFVVVLRRASFAAHALPMAAFPGAALARLLDVAPTPLVAVFALGSAGVLSVLHQRARPGTATALLLAGLMALGALFLSLSGGYAGNVYALLFGQVLGVGRGAVGPSVALGLGVPLLVLLGWRPLLLGALRGGADLYTFGLIALAATAALPIAGALLSFSLMTGPAAAARLLTARPLVALGLSMAIALGVAWASLALSVLTDAPVGFFVGFLSAGVYAAAQVAQRPSSSTTA